jgi:hypothetical protein
VHEVEIPMRSSFPADERVNSPAAADPYFGSGRPQQGKDGHHVFSVHHRQHASGDHSRRPSRAGQVRVNRRKFADLLPIIDPLGADKAAIKPVFIALMTGPLIVNRYPCLARVRRSDAAAPDGDRAIQINYLE